MKNFMRLFLITIIFTMNFIATSRAQAVVDSTHNATIEHTRNYSDDNHSNWGLLGLIGLIGLAGLTKRAPVLEKRTEYRDTQTR